MVMVVVRLRLRLPVSCENAGSEMTTAAVAGLSSKACSTKPQAAGGYGRPKLTVAVGVGVTVIVSRRGYLGDACCDLRCAVPMVVRLGAEPRACARVFQ